LSTLDLRIGTSQQHTLSPRLQHAARLLQLSSIDFATALGDTVARNPFLELDDLAEGGADTEREAADGTEPAAEEAAERPGAEDADGDDTPDDRDLWLGDGAASAASRRDDGEPGSPLDLLAADTSLASHLRAQLVFLDLDADTRTLARCIVESLDEDGYLRQPFTQLLPPHGDGFASPGPADWERALEAVQSLDPAGVGARSVAECLCLQLPGIECPRMRALAELVVREHLDLLAARDTAGIARRVQRPVAQVDAACQRLRRLDPRPGWRFGGAPTRYVVPDVIARRGRRGWTAELNPAVVPRVRVNEVYAELLHREGRRRQPAALSEHLSEARWTVRNVRQRFATILDVARAIVQRQHAFFEHGSMAMKPLALKDIAGEVGVHESTVSRVTNNKYIATPGGVLELKRFFSRALVTASGRPCSGTAIRGLVQEMIAEEVPAAPLSDSEITRRLATQGLVVARRTVTKYRQLLKIEAVERRRHLAA
jgi:RNA polymerase sigma-54 factor